MAGESTMLATLIVPAAADIDNENEDSMALRPENQERADRGRCAAVVDVEPLVHPPGRAEVAAAILGLSRDLRHAREEASRPGATQWCNWKTSMKTGP
jgi:hypothetical protein